MGEVTKLSIQVPEHEPWYRALQVEVPHPDNLGEWVVVQCAVTYVTDDDTEDRIWTEDERRVKNLDVSVPFPDHATIYRLGWVPRGGQYVDHYPPLDREAQPDLNENATPVPAPTSRRGAPGGYS